MPVYDVLPALEESVFDDAVATVLGGKPLAREAMLRRRDGTTYPVELRVDAAEQGPGQRIAAVAIDQSERKAAQREIDLLMRSINATSDVVLIYRVEPQTGTLRLSFMNDAYTHQTGYAREEVLGRDLDSFRLAMPDDEGMREIRAAIVESRSAEAEVISYRKDGSTFWNQVAFHPIFDAGRITHWVSIERDISEEVERTSALAEEHDRLLALAQAARRLFTVFDARQLVAVVKEVARELLQVEVRVLAAQPNGSAVEVDQLGSVVSFPAAADTAISGALAKRGRVVADDHMTAALYAGQFGDGRYVLEARAPGGRALRNTDLFMLDLIAEYFAVAARNVALYHELDERRSAVLELSQTKSDLIAMLAHDFRGPLTSIVGYADLIPEVAKLDEEPLEYLDAIKRAALQLSELASDTLTFSRLERNEVALQLSDVDLGALVAEIVEQYADRREVDVTVSGDARVIGDDERLRQVFANLIDNAIKYTPSDAKPSVEIDGGTGSRDGGGARPRNRHSVVGAIDHLRSLFASVECAQAEYLGNRVRALLGQADRAASWRHDCGREPRGAGQRVHRHDPSPRRTRQRTANRRRARCRTRCFVPRLRVARRRVSRSAGGRDRRSRGDCGRREYRRGGREHRSAHPRPSRPVAGFRRQTRRTDRFRRQRECRTPRSVGHGPAPGARRRRDGRARTSALARRFEGYTYAMADHMTNDRGHDSGEKGNKIEVPVEDVDRDDDDEAWSPDNDLSKEEPTLGDIPANEGGPRLQGSPI